MCFTCSLVLTVIILIEAQRNWPVYLSREAVEPECEHGQCGSRAQDLNHYYHAVLLLHMKALVLYIKYSVESFNSHYTAVKF